MEKEHGKKWVVALIAPFCMLMWTWAGAAPLNLPQDLYPRISPNFIDISYDASTHQFNATGFAGEYVVDSATSAYYIYAGDTGAGLADYGSFNLTAEILNDGTLVGGSFSITGYVQDLASEGLSNTGTLLTGDLTLMGYSGDGIVGDDTMEFMFDYTGGDAMSLFSAVRDKGGIILSMWTLYSFSPFQGDFSTSFDNMPGLGFGVADVTPAPIPGAVWLFASGLMGLLGFRKKILKL